MSVDDSPVLLDVSRLIWRVWRGQLPTGIDRACLAYVSHYRRRALAVIQRGGFTRILGRKDSQALFDLLLLPRQRSFRADMLRVLAWAMLPGRCPSRKRIENLAYINVGHTGLERAGHGRWVNGAGVRAIYYVHDLIPITHPEFVREGEPARHAVRMETVLKHGAGIIANSRDSLDALAAFARKKGMPVPPSLCAPLGRGDINSLSPISVSAPVDRPYFVVLGTIEGRKNHQLLLDVWRNLTRRLGRKAPMLVIIGQRGWAAEEIFAQLDEDELLRPNILELGRCDDRELSIYLSHARALLFPSFVEGQGLPLIEALAVGVPVIASNLAVFKEMAGDVPDYLDPRDVEKWSEAVLEYADPQSSQRMAQIERMDGFAPFEWQDHFVRVDVWLNTLMTALNDDKVAWPL